MNVKWENKSTYEISDSNFLRLFEFFVIESPIENTSQRGRTFADRKCNLNSLYYSILRSVPIMKNNWKVATKTTNVEQLLQQGNIGKNVDLPMEYIVHCKRYDSDIKGLYYAIRCALAHGGFSIYEIKDDKYYLLENKDRGYVKGRLVLKETSLLGLIEAVNNVSGKKLMPLKKAKK